MRLKHSALILSAGFLLMPTLMWSQGPGGGFPGGGGFGQPGGGAGGGLSRMDPDMMFNMLSGGKDVINLDQLDPRMKGMMDRFGPMLGLSGNQISRDQFRQSMGRVREMAASGQLPMMGQAGGQPGAFSGMPGGQEGADRRFEDMFKQYDKNQNGVLEFDEMSETLRAERDNYDTDRNGVIDLNEFKNYISARMGRSLGIQPGQPGAPGGPAPDQDEVRRPTVIRAGNLPRDFPYAALDTDADGQIGLYEWKAAGRRISEFVTLDTNNDGFLTVDEYYRYRTAQMGGPPKSTTLMGGDSPTMLAGGPGMNRGGGFGQGGGFNPGAFGQGGGFSGQGGGFNMANFGGGFNRGPGGPGGDAMSFRMPGGGGAPGGFNPGGMTQGPGGFNPGAMNQGGRGQGGFNPGGMPQGPGGFNLGGANQGLGGFNLGGANQGAGGRGAGGFNPGGMTFTPGGATGGMTFTPGELPSGMTFTPGAGTGGFPQIGAGADLTGGRIRGGPGGPGNGGGPGGNRGGGFNQGGGPGAGSAGPGGNPGGPPGGRRKN